MFQFAWYKYNRWETSEGDILNLYFYMDKMKGKIELTNLEITSFSYYYCIHTEGLNPDIVQKISRSRHYIEKTQWFLNRYDKENGILTLEDESEILDMFYLAQGNGMSGSV